MHEWPFWWTKSKLKKKKVNYYSFKATFNQNKIFLLPLPLSIHSLIAQVSARLNIYWLPTLCSRHRVRITMLFLLILTTYCEDLLVIILFLQMSTQYPEVKDLAQDYIDIKWQSRDSNQISQSQLWFSPLPTSPSIILGRKWTRISQTSEYRCQLLAGRKRSQRGRISKLELNLSDT